MCNTFAHFKCCTQYSSACFLCCSCVYMSLLVLSNRFDGVHMCMYLMMSGSFDERARNKIVYHVQHLFCKLCSKNSTGLAQYKYISGPTFSTRGTKSVRKKQAFPDILACHFQDIDETRSYESIHDVEV